MDKKILQLMREMRLMPGGLGGARLVYLAESEEAGGESGEVGKESEGEPERTDEEDVAAAAAEAARGDTRKSASEADEPDKDEKADAVLAGLDDAKEPGKEGGSGEEDDKTEQTEPAPVRGYAVRRETRESSDNGPYEKAEVSRVWKKFWSEMQKIIKELETNREQFLRQLTENPRKFAEEMGEKFKALMNERELKVLEWALNSPVTADEEKAFRKRFSSDKSETGKVRLADLSVAFKMSDPDSFDIRDFQCALRLVTDGEFREEVKDHPEVAAAFQEATRLLKRDVGKMLDGVRSVDTPFTFEQIKAGFEKYLDKPWCKDFLEHLDDEEKKATFLANVESGDKAMLEWAISAKPTAAEKKRVERILSGKMPETEEEVKAFVEKCGPRAMIVAKSLAGDAIAETEDENASALKYAAEAGGFMVILQKFLEKLTALFGKLEGKISEMFKTADTKKGLDTSPIGGDKKFEITKSFQDTKGKGVELTAESSGQDVTSVDAGGKVVNLDESGGQVTVEYGGGVKIIYGGVSGIAVEKDAEVTKGQKLGVMAGNTMTLQVLGDNNEQKDPTGLLKNFNLKEQAVVTPELPALPDKATNSPLATPLEIAKDFSATGKKGIVLKATKNDPVQMMATGIIKTASGDTLEVSYKDGVTLTYKGLKSISANANETLAAGKPLGVLSDAGELTIQISKEGQTEQIDPTPFVAAFKKPA